MKRMILAVAMAALSVTTMPAIAAPPGGCPPGLAKKTPACVPPGLAKKGVTARDWRAGDRFDGRGDPVDWWRYDLPRPRSGEEWIRVGDVILRVNDETRLVLTAIRLADAILSN